MSILRITCSNLKKKKGAAISLGILVVLTSFLMNIGLNLLLDSENTVLERIEALHGPHFNLQMGSNHYMPEYRTFFEEDARVTEVELEPVITMNNVKTIYGNGEMELAATFQNMDSQRTILPFQAMEQAEHVTDNGIYLPIGMKEGTPALGEEFPMIYKNKTYLFTVAGYFETPLHGTANTGIIKYFLTDAGYRKLSDEIGTHKMISVRLRNPKDSEALKADFKEFTKEELSDDSISQLTQFGFNDMVFVGTVMPNMFSAGLLGFACIILIVSALVAKFRISANIEDNVHNIGVLGAIGYTSGQIMLAMILEFAVLAAAGSLFGVLLAGAAMPVLGRMLISVSGIIWQGRIAFLPSALSILLPLLFVLSVTLWDAGRIRRLQPVVALRGGLQTHNFHKNYFALDKPGGILLRLAGKYAAINPRQNILLGTVTAGVVFILMLAMLLYTNVVKDQTALIRMSGAELSDVVVHLTKHTDAGELKQQLTSHPSVRKLSMVDVVTSEIEGETVVTEVSDDYRDMETLNVYEGDFPGYANETVITGVMADHYGKGIGDTIDVQYAGITAPYLITGLTQSTNLEGRMCFMTLEGVRRLDPYYMQKSISVYLKEGVDVDQFIEELQQEFSILPAADAEDGEGTANAAYVEAAVREKMADLLTMYETDSLQYALMKDGEILLSGSSADYKIEYLENYKRKIQAQLYSMGMMFIALTQVIAIFSVFIVALILNMLIRAMIRRWRQEFGIQKALGYTSGQLAVQIVGSILPAALLGVVCGGLLGSMFANSLFSLMFYNVGISNLILVMSPWLVIGICTAVLLTVLLFAFAAAVRIRRISVYGLLTE